MTRYGSWSRRKEGRQRLHAVGDVAAEEDAALVGQAAADHDVDVAELPGQQQALEYVEPSWTPPVPSKTVLDASLAYRVVELLRLGVDDDVVLRLLAVVDLRPA